MAMRGTHSICSRFFSYKRSSSRSTVTGFPPMAGAMRSAKERIHSLRGAAGVPSVGSGVRGGAGIGPRAGPFILVHRAVQQD
jgi:hypothetical protein